MIKKNRQNMKNKNKIKSKKIKMKKYDKGKSKLKSNHKIMLTPTKLNNIIK